MNLKSKLPIVVIVFTFLLFLVLSLRNNNDKLTIKTLKGNINEIKNLAISYENNEGSKYIINQYTLEKGNTRKQTIPTKYYGEKNNSKVFNLIDVLSGNDNISNIGYEYIRTKENYITDIKFIYDEIIKIDENTILQTQGKDNVIYDQNINKENIKRNTINVDFKEIFISSNIEVLASNRYKDEIYIMSNYCQEYSYNNIIEISKLNVKNNKLEIVDKIELIDSIDKKYPFLEISVVDSTKYKNKFYSVVSVKNGDDSVIQQGKLYLLDYDLDKNTYSINSISEKEYLKVIDSSFDEGKLNLITSDINENIVISDISYDLINNNKIFENDILIEKNINKDPGRSIHGSLVDNEKIYIYVSNFYFSGWQDKNKVYVIDRNNQNISYEGKIIQNPNNCITEFKKVGKQDE
ncbi:hypothetical protein [Clostridium sp. CCUG 7971]|uniref:hypothetical protein n=1 Tax=Clostridium sp. CCUG 7971 TaxID=2811414 RepID=UPI001ABB5813|nr:hypothetical protein [Clostridium sp. CCUG 7971]MBO3446502.1 hypothetical protein [Clostridium sp. CCUG 7971]